MYVEGHKTADRGTAQPPTHLSLTAAHLLLLSPYQSDLPSHAPLLSFFVWGCPALRFSEDTPKSGTSCSLSAVMWELQDCPLLDTQYFWICFSDTLMWARSYFLYRIDSRLYISQQWSSFLFPSRTSGCSYPRCLLQIRLTRGAIRRRHSTTEEGNTEGTLYFFALCNALPFGLRPEKPPTPPQIVNFGGIVALHHLMKGNLGWRTDSSTQRV